MEKEMKFENKGKIRFIANGNSCFPKEDESPVVTPVKNSGLFGVYFGSKDGKNVIKNSCYVC